MRKLFLRSFGCQMNEYDSDRIGDVLREAEGLVPTERPEEADVIVFNTCSVREKAQEKVFADLGRVRHLKQARPEVMIAVGGCVASQEARGARGRAGRPSGRARRAPGWRPPARRRLRGARGPRGYNGAHSDPGVAN